MSLETGIEDERDLGVGGRRAEHGIGGEEIAVRVDAERRPGNPIRPQLHEGDGGLAASGDLRLGRLVGVHGRGSEDCQQCGPCENGETVHGRRPLGRRPRVEAGAAGFPTADALAFSASWPPSSSAPGRAFSGTDEHTPHGRDPTAGSSAASVGGVRRNPSSLPTRAATARSVRLTVA